MKKTVLALLFLLIFIVTSLSGCAARNSGGSDINLGEVEYAVGVKIGEWETRGKLFFDREGALHFLHEDPTSPLFSLEEVFQGDFILSDYQSIHYESQNKGYGTGMLWDVFDLIQRGSPVKTVKTKEKVIYEYESGKDLAFSLEADRESASPLQISGVGKDLAFSITFNQERIK